ncbi:hypothetical protein VNO80_25259 [Phaseolus coccineus]|uniref:Uncharacterized protein n=1 Tax=Phaseolus coccineus TaxID=3886 RepID=A0AAN9LUA8_PHACN
MRCAWPSSITFPPRNTVAQESREENLQEGGLWDPTLDAPFFLKKTLLPTKAKEKLESLGEDPLMGQTARQLGQALAANCLVFLILRRWKDSAKEEVLKAAELVQRVGGLMLEVEELQSTHRETKTENSKEALDLSAKNAELHTEVEKLREELAKKDDELVQKDELMEKTKEALTNDTTNSYMASSDDAITEATCIYPESDF